MKKLLIIMMLFTASCHPAPKIPNQVVKFVTSSGKVEIEVDKKGEWVKIKSSGSAPIQKSDNLEYVMNVATLRAKANLVEFINNDIKSFKSTEAVIETDSEQEISSTLISKVTENISSESRLVIRGAYVAEREVSNDQSYVRVVIIVDRKIMEITNKIF